MQFNRRDALKLGVVSAAALALPAERMARTKLSFANKLAVSSMPPPFTAPYVAPPVVDLTRRRHHRPHQRRQALPPHGDVAVPTGDHSGAADHSVGIRPVGARTHGDVQEGRAGLDAARQQPALAAPATGIPAVDIGAPARLGVAAAVRRVRERRRQPRPVQGLPVPKHPAGAHDVVSRPRCAPDRVQRLHGAGRAVPHRRRPGAVAAAAEGDGLRGQVLRPGADHPGRDLRRGRVVDLRRRRPVEPVRERHLGERATLAGDEGGAPQVPLPHPQRVDLPSLQVGTQQRSAVHHDRHRRRVDAATPVCASLPARHGRALRGGHRLLQVPDRRAGRAAEPCAAQQRRLRAHQQGHGLRRGQRIRPVATTEFPSSSTPAPR